MNAAHPGPVCLWCDRPYRSRGACGKRFCSDRCRAAFHRGCRLWAMRAVGEGLRTWQLLGSLSGSVAAWAELASELAAAAQKQEAPW